MVLNDIIVDSVLNGVAETESAGVETGAGLGTLHSPTVVAFENDALPVVAPRPTTKLVANIRAGGRGTPWTGFKAPPALKVAGKPVIFFDPIVEPSAPPHVTVQVVPRQASQRLQQSRWMDGAWSPWTAVGVLRQFGVDETGNLRATSNEGGTRAPWTAAGADLPPLGPGAGRPAR